MTLEELAVKLVEAAEASGVPFMVVGDLAAGAPKWLTSPST